MINEVEMREIRKYGDWKKKGASLGLTTIENRETEGQTAEDG